MTVKTGRKKKSSAYKSLYTNPKSNITHPKTKPCNVFYSMMLVTHFIDYPKVKNRSKPSLVYIIDA